MKNLFLPFVVVALFAFASCGDDAVQPDTDPQDTTIGKDTTGIYPQKAIQIDSLKEFIILGLTSEQRYYRYYRDINNNISEKTDIVVTRFDQDYHYHPGLPNKPVPAYFNPSYHVLEFSFPVLSSAYAGNAKLSCKLDTNSGIITDFIYQYNSLSAGSNNPKGSYERKSGLYLHINKIPYTISKDTLTCQIEGTQLQKAIIDFDHSSSFRSSYPSSHEYYEYNFIKLMPFATDALVRFKFIIKK